MCAHTHACASLSDRACVCQVSSCRCMALGVFPRLSGTGSSSLNREPTPWMPEGPRLPSSLPQPGLRREAGWRLRPSILGRAGNETQGPGLRRSSPHGVWVPPHPWSISWWLFHQDPRSIPENRDLSFVEPGPVSGTIGRSGSPCTVTTLGYNLITPRMWYQDRVQPGPAPEPGH